jgi:hypothetical protein
LRQTHVIVNQQLINKTEIFIFKLSSFLRSIPKSYINSRNQEGEE